MADVTTQAPEFIKLLAHDLRWQLLQSLSSSDLRVQELTTRVNQPMNLVSYHLKKLRSDGVVTTRRSEADARDMYYSLDIGNLRARYQAAGVALHPALSAEEPARQTPSLPARRVLFVCTHNSARSQMAEGLMHQIAGNRIQVQSAGSYPTRLHPDAVRTMEALGIDISEQHAKDVHEFEGQAFDYVITVCDKAREVCPVFPGSGAHLHWGFPDPVNIEGTKERLRAFQSIARQLTGRIEFFLTTISSHD